MTRHEIQNENVKESVRLKIISFAEAAEVFEFINGRGDREIIQKLYANRTMRECASKFQPELRDYDF